MESSIAERFLKTDQLDKIALKDDPLTLVKKVGKTTGIDLGHKALVSIKDYLEKYGQTDGKKLLDDFYASPYGWSKDTTRYLIAALLVAGEIKLRVSGQDVTVRGQVAVESTKNTNSFNKIGIALRGSDNKPTPEERLRASERLLELTGDNVLPLEEIISKTVTKHFPDFQQDFAPLATQLKNLGLPGVEIAQSVQDSISEILKGDASDATHRLGGDPCPLYENLIWVRKVKKAFDNDIEAIIRKVNHYLTAIPALPNSGIPGELIHGTETMRQGLQELIGRNDFFDTIPELQTRLGSLDSMIEEAASALIKDEQSWIENEKERLQKSKEWGKLGEDDRIAIGIRMDGLKVSVSADLKGIQKIISDHYSLMQEFKLIEEEIKSRAEADEDNGDTGGEGQELLDVEFSVLPIYISSPDGVDAIIKELESLKGKLGKYTRLRINWKTV